MLFVSTSLSGIEPVKQNINFLSLCHTFERGMTSDEPDSCLLCSRRQHLNTFAYTRLNIILLASSVANALGIRGEVNKAVRRVETFLKNELELGETRLIPYRQYNNLRPLV